MPTVLTDSIEIQCTPEVLYLYVTQPWLWHEWHPSSISAGASVDTLQTGDSFDEVIELRPLSPLPFRMRRKTRYQVIVADPFRSWEVHGKARDGWIRIRYEFQPLPEGTRFTRTLSYATKGPSALLMPLLRSHVAKVSRIALARLKIMLETRGEVQTHD